MNMRSPGLFRIGSEYSDNLFPILADKVYFRQAGKSGTSCKKYHKENECQQNTVFHFSSPFAVLMDFISITRICEQKLFNIRWLIYYL